MVNHLFNKNLLRGRIAECIVEQLFKDRGFNIYRFGYEAILQSFTQANGRLQRGNNINNMIRQAPDFIIEDNGYVNFVEAKFSAEGKYRLKKDYFWKDAFILVVSLTEPCFKIAKASDLLNGGRFRPLEQWMSPKFDNKILSRYCDLVKEYFSK